ncbi:MAG: HD domain-containing phosphohydrolase [Armatimonadota bacterium]|nr:HD domain-containing protein [Armatimonadota bacterium]MCX7777909.1 HD domain-containing protein [Armatimonadota bacterium]MDW8026121.1 HD domain-containing phosphohydrolase [Armatimonadota bacterium]
MRLFVSCFIGAMVCVGISVTASHVFSTSVATSIGVGVLVGILTAALLSTYIVDAFKRRIGALSQALSDCIRGETKAIERLRADELSVLGEGICQLVSKLQGEHQMRSKLEMRLGQVVNLLKRFQTQAYSEGDLKASLRHIRQLTNASECVILSYDVEDDAFSLRVEDGMPAIANEIRYGNISDSAWRIFLNRSEPLIVRRDDSDRFRLLQFGRQLPYDVMLIPLRSENQLLGILVLTKGNGAFSHDDYEAASISGALFSLMFRNVVLHERLTNLFIETVAALAEAVDAKDPYTRHHSKWVTQWAVLFGKWLNLQSAQIDTLHIGGLMHDLGKIAVPDEVLRKPQPLTPEEYELVKLHPSKGAEILSHVSLPWDVIPIVLHHHERWDGKGYPNGLRGEEIPLLARIVAIVDAFHAMTSDRAYRPALPIDEALRRVLSEAGKQFDPTLASSFVQLVYSNMSAFTVNER